eukprot:gnl/TRDRNA2_/TRDRNA2_86181_c0_seq1.p1 gnl/TRDRNA2_/TRDRNA2_86181_c0~~gnl/TRDRNA2_/TRDRNA2_86181_c0_seq1.p1  ORF type:complete len:174 (-),score=47.32 gnl/TRDRNA2_/TRDRNA2_86181_c0_seq1:181-663(-)
MQALDSAVRERRQDVIRSHLVVTELMRKQQVADRSLERMPGWVVIFDMEGMTLRHVCYPLVLDCVKEVAMVLQRYYPNFVECAFVLNAPPVFHIVWRVLSQFVKEKTRAKVHILPKGNYKELLAECGASYLPSKLGGCRPSTSDEKDGFDDDDCFQDLPD